MLAEIESAATDASASMGCFVQLVPLLGLQDHHRCPTGVSMGLMGWLTNSNHLPFAKKLEWYPPFLFMGVKIHVASDYRHMELVIPLRWYGKNNNGVLFGGFMLMASDPFPALLFQKIFPNIAAWNVGHGIKYLRPAKSAVTMRIDISDADIEDLKGQLQEKGRAQRTFKYDFRDENDKRIARVTTKAYLKQR